MKEIDEAAFAEDAKDGMKFKELVVKYSINVPADRLMDILRGLELAELVAAIESLEPLQQATIFRAVMQKKFDRLLLPVNMVELPSLSVGEKEYA